MLQFGSTEVLSLLIVVSIFVDLVAIRSSTEHKSDRFFRQATVISIISILMGIIMTTINAHYLDSIPEMLFKLLQSLHLLSFPLMVLLWSHLILFNLKIKSFWYKLISTTSVNLLIIFCLILILDFFRGNLFVINSTNQVMGGFGIHYMATLCFSYSLMIFLVLTANYHRISKDKFYCMLAFPVMYSLSIWLFLLTGSHQTFTISQSLSVFSIFLVIQNRRLRYDSLTGLPTMRRFLGSLDRAFRHSHSCAIVLFDISDLKAFNHKFGHKQGDRLLQALAQKLCDESLGEKLKR